MALQFITLVFTIASFVLLLIANLGTTFESTFLPSIYLIQFNEAVTGRYIRYGVYNSCLYYADSKVAHSCTDKIPGYSFDAKQFAEFCGADLTNTTMVQPYEAVVADANLDTFKFILLIMPAVILAFLAFLCTVTVRKMQKNNVIPFIGTFTSLFGFFAGGAGLALTIVTFWKGLAKLEPRIEGLSHQWGPSVYLVGVGSGCALFAFICFVIILFSHSSESHKRETYNLYDYADGGANSTSPKQYDATTKLSSSIKHDSYNDYYHAVSTPTVQSYPSYNQQYQPQLQYQQTQYQTQPQYQQQQYSKETSYQQPSGNYY